MNHTRPRWHFPPRLQKRLSSREFAVRRTQRCARGGAWIAGRGINAPSDTILPRIIDEPNNKLVWIRPRIKGMDSPSIWKLYLGSFQAVKRYFMRTQTLELTAGPAKLLVPIVPRMPLR